MASDRPALPDPADFLGVDAELTAEERDIRDAVRDYAQAELAPHISEWYESNTLPRDIAKGLGSLGLLGMHLEGYGCAGTNATGYGLACRELEAIDSGLRSFVSRAGLARDVRDPPLGLARSTSSVAAAHGHRRGPRLLRAHRARRRVRPGRRCGPAPAATGRTGCSTAPRCGSPTAPSPTSRWSGRRPTRSGAGDPRFRRPTDTPGFTANEVQHKLSLRASLTAELVLEGVRLPARRGVPRGARARRAR